MTIPVVQFLSISHHNIADLILVLSHLYVQNILRHTEQNN